MLLVDGVLMLFCILPARSVFWDTYLRDRIENGNKAAFFSESDDERQALLSKREDTFGSCGYRERYQIIRSAPVCVPRKSTVKIPLLENDGTYHVVPSHTTIDRCQGSCWSLHHSCVPTKTEMVPVRIMAVKYRSKIGAWPTQCTETFVQRHLACMCGCELQEEDCGSQHEFDLANCRCVCKDKDEMETCADQDKVWDSNNCVCKCPIRHCTTGYIYDAQNSCQCVPVLLQDV